MKLLYWSKDSEMFLEAIWHPLVENNGDTKLYFQQSIVFRMNFKTSGAYLCRSNILPDGL